MDAHGAPFSWSAHPLRERKAAGAAAALVILAAGVAAAMAGGNVSWGILAVAVLILSLNRFFLPSRFEADAEGITARYPLRTERHAWTSFERWASDERAAHLLRPSPGSGTRTWARRPDRLEILLGSNREAVLATLRAHLGEARS